jgi:hypothetical protein
MCAFVGVIGYIEWVWEWVKRERYGVGVCFIVVLCVLFKGKYILLWEGRRESWV